MDPEPLPGTLAHDIAALRAAFRGLGEAFLAPERIAAVVVAWLTVVAMCIAGVAMFGWSWVV